MARTSSPLGSSSDESEAPPEFMVTDPADVEKPVIQLVHKKLADAWKVHPQHQMCYIFDFVTPGRQWKRGARATEENPYAMYGPSPWPDLTESDDAGVLQPYYPREFL